MMEAKNISFAYGRTPTLKQISINLEPGKLYAIIGPNGSGKTTLVKLLARLAKPKSGQLFLDGKEYGSFGRKAFAKQAALLPQGRNVPGTTVFDLISCGRYPYLGLSRKLSRQDLEAVHRAMALTETEAFAGRNVKKLSGGERQRVYMAMLYAQDAPYVLLDEPTTHLDIASSFEIMEQLLQMKREGKCVAAVLHDLAMALKYADEVILMAQGEVLFCGAPKETVESGLLRSVFHVNCTPVTVGEKTEYLFEHIS